MSALGLVSLIIFIFFVIGIGVGVIAVVALAVTRRDRAPRWVAPEFREDPGRDGAPDAASGVAPSGEEIGCDDDTWPQWPETGYRP